MTSAQTAWVVTQIEAVSDLDGNVFVTTIGDAAKAAPPYVVVQPSDGLSEQTRFTGGRSTTNPRFTLHSVGVDAAQAQAIGDTLKAVFIVNGLGIVPSVAGENSRRVWWDSPTPIQVDKDVVPWMVFHVAECGWTAELL